MAKDEPQSYGSGKDWLTGNTAQDVNRQKGNPNSQHGDFYQSRRDSEGSAEDQGGQISDEQLAENVEAQGNATPEDQPITKVTDQAGGAKRGGFFKDRDYK
jgi:hypothetical protein